MIKAVILAAGRGTRMGPLTQHRPKPMLPLANTPLLGHIVQALKKAGLRELLVVIGYKAEKIQEYLGDGGRFGVRVEYLHQREQLGTAYAIAQAEKYVDGPFLALNGDVLLGEKDLKLMLGHLKDLEEKTVIGAVEKQDPRNYGVMEVKNGKITGILEKPEPYSLDKPLEGLPGFDKSFSKCRDSKSRGCWNEVPAGFMVNTGVYLFTPGVFQAIRDTPKSSRGEYEITTSLQILIDTGSEVVFQRLEGWRDLTYPWDLLDVNQQLLAADSFGHEVKGTVEPYTTLKGKVVVGEGTVIRSGAYILGPVVIGRNCDIGPNCFIRPYTAIGDGVRIGNAVEVKNSIIMENTKIGHLSYVGDSVIAADCNFGAGTKIANLRHDGRTIRVKINNKILDSKRRKLGAIIGDHVHTGINSMINVGAVLESGSWLLPGEFYR